VRSLWQWTWWIGPLDGVSAVIGLRDVMPYSCASPRSPTFVTRW
jgi:hypothetical protein